MPVLKWGYSHAASCKAVHDYLTKSERHIACDYQGCLEKDRHGRPWWLQMDELRHATQLDQDASSAIPSVSYLHLKLSCDPRDAVSLHELRDLCRWLLEAEFSGTQAVACYHDDSRLHIPHAHLVINIARLNEPRALVGNDNVSFIIDQALQREAATRGLRAFDTGHVSVTPEEWFADWRHWQETGVRGGGSATPTYLIEKDVEREQEGTSLKHDVRERMKVALAVSATSEEFLDACRMLGLSVREARGRRYAGEQVFSLPFDDHEFCGARLGSDWSSEGIERRLEEGRLAHDDAKRSAGRILLEELTSAADPTTAKRCGILANTQEREITVAEVSALVHSVVERGLIKTSDLEGLLEAAVLDDMRLALAGTDVRSSALGTRSREGMPARLPSWPQETGRTPTAPARTRTRDEHDRDR